MTITLRRSYACGLATELRAHPQNSSERVQNFEGRTVEIEDGAELHPVSYDLENGFLKVIVQFRRDWHVGFLHMRHVHWEEENGVVYTELNDEMWNRPWYFQSHWCHIRVSHGGGNREDVERELSMVGVDLTRRDTQCLI